MKLSAAFEASIALSSAMCPMLTNSSRVLRESRTIQIIEPICSTAGSPISITNETMPGFLTTSGELISATPAQPSLLAVMVARLDDPDAVAARAVRLGQHGQSDSSVNPPPYLGFVVPPEHPLLIKELSGRLEALFRS